MGKFMDLLAHGIGGAMFEDLVYADDGQLLSSTFIDYLLPTAGDMPQVFVDSIETPSLTLGGFKGLGKVRPFQQRVRLRMQSTTRFQPSVSNSWNFR